MKRGFLLLLLRILLPLIILIIIVWLIFFAGTIIGKAAGETIEKHIKYNPATVKKIESAIEKWKKAFEPALKTWECINDPEKCYTEPWEEVQSMEHKEQVEKRYGIEIIPPINNPEGFFSCNKKKVLIKENDKEEFLEADCEGSEVPIYFNVRVNLPLGEKVKMHFDCYVDPSYECEILKIENITPKSLSAGGLYEGQVACVFQFNPDFYKNKDCLYDGKIKNYYEIPVTFKVSYEASSKTDFWILIVKPEAYSPDFFERYKLDRMKYTVSRWIGVPSVTVALGSPSGREAVYIKKLPIYLAAVLRKAEDIQVDNILKWKICFPKEFNVNVKDILLPSNMIDEEAIKEELENNYKCIVFLKDAIKEDGIEYLNKKGYLPILLKLNYAGNLEEDYAEYYVYSEVLYKVSKSYALYIKYSGVFLET